MAAIRAHPTACYWIAGLLVYGLAALHFAGGHFLDETSRDLWQHLASLRALIENPFDPANPFVPGDNGSRHFHPFWVGMALLARLLDWTEVQTIAAAGFVTGGMLLAGIYAFSRAFYPSPWGPVALLAAMVLSWSIPISHTGFHSIETLIEGLGYPAVLLIGLSLVLWALVIRALVRPIWAMLIAPVAALMFATHQLGAGIGFVTASTFVVFWPEGTLKARAASIVALVSGVALSTLWPYHGPFEAIARAGNPTWTGGINFYDVARLLTMAVPSLIGLLGLLHPDCRRRALPVLVSFTAFALIFAGGKLGPLIATRFGPPMMLMLHIGVATLFLSVARRWESLHKASQLGLFGIVFFFFIFRGIMVWEYLSSEKENFKQSGNAYAHAEALTADIPDQQPVGAWDVAAWPVVATGQRAMSVPWPEPMIDGLAERQAAVEQLFRPEISRKERLALARRWGVKTLILDRRGPLRRHMPENLIQRLKEDSVRHSASGDFLRFDLE